MSQINANNITDSNIDIIPMAFLFQMTTGTGGQPVINFANSGNNCTTFNGTGLIDCPDIGNDITTCQTKYNKKVLLSVGGATYTEGGFTSEDKATAAAKQMWATFGPAQDGSDALRPFGNASIDGFDLDFESTVTNMVPFASTLRSLMDDASGSSSKVPSNSTTAPLANSTSAATPTSTAVASNVARQTYRRQSNGTANGTDSSAATARKFYLTAAPQCPYPDAADNEMLNGTISFDAVFVQFYNNYCGVQSFTPTSAATSSSTTAAAATSTSTVKTRISARQTFTDPNPFNFATWDNWAKTVSKNPNVQVFVGVPAGQTAAGTGYTPADKLAPVIAYAKTYKSFGGVMMWDASQAFANTGFLDGVKKDIGAAPTRRRVVRKEGMAMGLKWSA